MHGREIARAPRQICYLDIHAIACTLAELMCSLRSPIEVAPNLILVNVGCVAFSAARCICSAGFERSIPEAIIGIWKGGGVCPGSWKTLMVGVQLVSLPTYVTKQYGLTDPSGSASATHRD